MRGNPRRMTELPSPDQRRKESQMTLALALATEIPSDVLGSDLPSHYADVLVRYESARNPNTPARILTLLSADVDFSVLMGVAQNCNTPAAALEFLSTECYCEVRFAVGRNPSTPRAIVERLYRDADVSRNVWRCLADTEYVSGN